MAEKEFPSRTSTTIASQQPEKRKKDNSQAFTHFLVECGRIINVLAETITRLHYMLCLSKVIENDYEYLHYFCSELQMKKVKMAFEPYASLPKDEKVDRHTTAFYVSSANSLECIFNKYTYERSVNGTKNGSEILQTVEMLLQNKDIIKLCEDTLISQLSDPATDFLSNMNQLKYFVTKKLHFTPVKAERRKFELSKIYRENEWMKKELRHLKSEVKDQKKNNSEIIAELDSKIEAVQKEMEQIIKYCSESSIKNMKEAEEKMQWDWKVSEYKEEKLVETAQKLEADSEAQLKLNFAAEKVLRIKRSKVLVQLISVLAKYDADMADRHTQLETLKKEFSEEQEILAKLQEKFNCQADEYEVLMAEKEAYEENNRRTKLEEIQNNIAARKIQRYFRFYVEFCAAHGIVLAKKKKAKGKKK